MLTEVSDEDVIEQLDTGPDSPHAPARRPPILPDP